VPSPRILIVDDEVDQRSALRTTLENAGHEVIEASDGREALHHLTSDEPPPDLILLDLRMPEMSGWEFASLVARYTRLTSIPIVVLSGVTELLHGIRPLISTHVQKPVAADALLAVVGEQLRTAAEKRRMALINSF
jgi:CheY-like chemotaxis protein